MSEDQRLLNELGQIRELAVTIKNQPPSQRRHTADKIIAKTTTMRSRILEKTNARAMQDTGHPRMGDRT